ncbi:uncharacterized protein [Rutidosis leptorrhynchoides]|uniref:uncharacterized protein n=1 Tax=Rutidosis leptorrhynchoides TaxID=125765 RepID=UPI003A99F93E
MDACHLLLGRPWLFNKYVCHNGNQNTYSLYVKGKKITFTSLKPSEIPRADPTVKSDKTLFMTQAEVDTELKGGTGAYLLMLVESDELNQHDEVPAQVKPLLSKFADVFPCDLPASLPPIKGIEHQIDLVPGSVLPKKVAYRCSPHESKELERQFNELVAKGEMHKHVTFIVSSLHVVEEYNSPPTLALISKIEKLEKLPSQSIWGTVDQV